MHKVAPPRTPLFLFTRQEHPQRPLDSTRAAAREGLATVRPGLDTFEVGMSSHECAAIFCLILAAAAFPGAVQADVLAADRAGAALPFGFDAAMQSHNMRILRGASCDRHLDCLAPFAGSKGKLVADQGAAIDGVAYLRHRRSRRKDDR